jgi:hypothetical protein
MSTNGLALSCFEQLVVDVQSPNQKQANNIFTEFPPIFTQIPASMAPAPRVSMITPGISSFSFTNSLGMFSALNINPFVLG